MNTCPACKTELGTPPSFNGGWAVWDCPCCGVWGLTDHLMGRQFIPNLSGEELSKIKHLLCEHRIRLGSAVILSQAARSSPSNGTTFILKDEFLTRYPKRPLEYFDRALENLSRLVRHPVAYRALKPEEASSLFSDGDDVDQMLHKLSGLGYINISGGRQFTVLPKGWARIQELQSPGRDSKQGFVAMWFDPTQTEFFEKGFKPAIEEDKKFTALRIDRKDHNNRIDDEIISEIRRSRFVVADFTSHRNGVYFEAGLGLGLGLPVIWTVHEDHRKESHFDTRQFNHISYKTPEELRGKLLNRIRATII